MAVEAVRHCRFCPTVLSRYNPSSECAACERETSSAPKSASSTMRRPKVIHPRRNIGSGRDPEVLVPQRSDEPLHTRIQRLRLARGWQQKQLADRCGLLKTTVQHAESGRNAPTLVTFERLCAGLGVTMDELWRGIGKANTVTTATPLDRASQALALLIGNGSVAAVLMPAAENALIEPTDTADVFTCRICAATVERGKPGLHDQKACVLAVVRPGHGEAS